MRAPDEVRGRVLAGDFAIVTLTLSITSALSGVVSDAIGVRSTIAVFAVLAAIAGTVYLVVTTPIRRSLRNEQPHR